MNSNSPNFLIGFIFIILGIVLVVLFYKYLKYKLKHKNETITAYTGGLGSGKTMLSVDKALSLYKKQLFKWKFKKFFKYDFLNLLRKKDKKLVYDVEKPILLSNIPILISKKNKKHDDIFCYQLRKEHLYLQERIPLKSVVLIDEVGAFANQFDFKDKNIIEVFDEFIRFYRHYTKGGFLVVNDQCSQNINLVIRRRINTIHNLANMQVFSSLSFYYERMINISEEIKTIDVRGDEQENDTQNSMNFRFKFLRYKKNYDSYCYSERYLSVPYHEINLFQCLKCLHILKSVKDSDLKYYPLTEKRKEDTKR